MSSRLQLLERYRNPDKFADPCDVPIREFEPYLKAPTDAFISEYNHTNAFICYGGKIPSDLLDCSNCPFSSKRSLQTFYEKLGWEYYEPTR